MNDYLDFKSVPSDASKGKKHIIIVGAGIMGVCTAYFLVTHPKYDPSKYHITIIESKRVAGGASGKAGGLLALWAFPKPIVPLSFRLHQELSDMYDGEKEWGYRRLTTVSLEGDVSKVTDEDLEKEGKTTPSKRRFNTLPEDLNWINSALVDSYSELGDSKTTAQVHPYKFTTFILKKAVELSHNSIELVLGKVSDITYSLETSSAVGVKYEPTSIKDHEKFKDKKLELAGDQVVMSVGPWTSKILPDCPISGLRAHSITISPYKDQPVSPYAIFSEFKTSPMSYVSPEIYARQDEVYVCGDGDSAVDVPETTDDVEVVTAKCDELFEQVSKFSSNLRKGKILRRQACYLPVLEVPTSSGPLIGETNVNNLFLCSGHSCWGINNGPGSGKLMSELLLDGKATSSKISSLDPSLYFDASILTDN